MERSRSVKILLCDGRKIVLVENSPKHKQPKHWGLPGGKVENGEGEMDAAKRESLEETGFEIETTPDDLINYDIYVNHYLFLVKGKITGGRLKTTAGPDTIRAAWFDLNQLPADIKPEDRERITKTLTRLR